MRVRLVFLKLKSLILPLNLKIIYITVPSKLFLSLKQKCPNCHKGDVFVYPNYHFHFMKMHEHCPKCGFKFEIETGFFWGSMYISYGISVVISLIIGIGLHFLINDPEVWVSLGIIAGVLFTVSPPIFRFSRMLMLYYFSFVDFEKKTK